MKRTVDRRRVRFTFKKVKAHRARSTAEVEGDESLRDWTGNDAADGLARALANSLRAADVREGPKQASHRATLQRMAMAAAWAWRHWPDTVQRKQKKKRWQKTQAATHGAGACGPHTLRARSGGGFECNICRLRTATASSLKSLRIKPCRGDVAQQAHATHQLRWSSGVYWC